MEIEKYYGIIKKFHAAGIHQHMYTNGTLATEENLKALGEAGLDELRFNLGATNASDKVIEAIAIAKKNQTFAVRFKTQQGWGNSFSAKPSPRAPPSGKHPLCFLEANHRDAVMASFYISKAVMQYCTFS